MTRFRFALLASCLLAAGCSLVLDPSAHQKGDGQLDAGAQDAAPGPDGGDEDGGGDSLDGGSDAGPSCPESLICEPGAPPGWNGPIVLVTGAADAPPPSCPATVPVTAFTALSGLEAPEATCGCACTPPPSGQLNCVSAGLTGHGSSACSAPGWDLGNISNAQCTNLNPVNVASVSLSRPSLSTSAPGCTPMPEVAMSPPSWGASHRACTFGAPTSCGSEQVCMPPRANGERLCIWVEGASECPAAFPARLETGEDVDDRRGCSPCTCGPIEGRCDGHVTIANDCSTPMGAARDVDVGGCHTFFTMPATPRVYARFTPTASCPPNAPTPTGEVVPTTQRTVCCAE